MIGDQKQREQGLINVGCKVPVWVAELLNIIAQGKGVSTFELFQRVVDFIISAAKAEMAPPPEMQTLLHMLEMDANWQNAFNFASTSAKMDVAQVILVLQQRDSDGNPKHGFGLVMIDKPFMGDAATQTLCVDDILERVAEVSMQGLYRQLAKIGASLDSQSLRETLTIMCDAQEILNIEEQNRHEMPALGNFHDFGKAVEFGQKNKRIRHRTPDSLANSQQRIQFDESDSMASYDEAVRDTDMSFGEHRQTEEPPEGMTRPFDQEW